MVFLNTAKSLEHWMRFWSWQYWMTSIFIMSDRVAFRGTFRIEANQTSKVELCTCKIASWTVQGFKLWNIFAQSSILTRVPTRGKTSQIGFSITYFWKVTVKTGMLKLPGAKHDDWNQKEEEIRIRCLNQVESTHSDVKKISKLRI